MDSATDATAKPMRQQIMLAKLWLPVGLVALALLVLAAGALVWVRRRSGDDAPDATPPPSSPTIDLRPTPTEAAPDPHAVATTR